MEFRTKWTLDGDLHKHWDALSDESRQKIVDMFKDLIDKDMYMVGKRLLENSQLKPDYNYDTPRL